MRIEQDGFGRLKQWVYIGSSAVLFLVWCLSLGALTQQGGADGRLAWVFGLCFLTIPLVIYQSLTPIWSRTARFSNPHAHCAVDGLLVIFWFSAWVSLTSFVASGKGAGNAKDKDGKTLSGCDNFSHGSSAKCRISEADIVFSVIMMLCFLVTAFFSFKVLLEYKRTGIAPNAPWVGDAGAGENVAKSDISYTQGYQEEDEAFDSRLNVNAPGRETGYSFEDARVQGGYGSLGEPQPYGGAYESVPGGDGYGHEHGHGHPQDESQRPTSFGGPLNRT